jgi:hemerythrin-like domain-containing protein
MPRNREEIMRDHDTRRRFLMLAGVTGSALLTSGVLFAAARQQEKKREGEERQGGEDKGKGSEEVTATEDLMREHGVLRRTLLVYAEVAARLRLDPGSLPAPALQGAAKLFRSFGEEYHEKKLEEAFIFPALKRAGGPAAGYADVLTAQHVRGREITDYILGATQGAKLTASAGPLADALTAFARMYQNHAAREDTIVFPAWKATVTEAEYRELGERFEEIEHQQFGEDGFEDAVKQIAQIETMLGLADLAQFTAPLPAAR